MSRVFVCGLAAALAFAATADACNGQSCASSAYGYARSYSTYRPSYSYAAPSYSYAAPAKVYQEYKAAAPAYKEEKIVFRYLAFFPVLEASTYGAAAYPAAPNGNGQGQFPAPALPGVLPQQQQPPPGGPAAAPRGDQMAQVLDGLNKLGDAVNKLNARLEAVEKRERQPEPKKERLPPKGKEPPPEPEPEPDKTALTFSSVNKAACAACHSRANAKEHGAEFVLSEDDGTIVKLSASRLKAMQRVLLKDTMPTINDHGKKHGIKDKLTKEQKDAIFRGLYEQIAAAE